MSGPVRQTVHYNNLSKAQLARIANQQGELVEQLTRQLRRTSQTLIAIVLAPEAFHPQTNGRASVDASALQRVAEGQVLHITTTHGLVDIRVVHPSALGLVEIPAIVVPPGVRG